MGRSPSSDKNGLKKGPWTPEEDTKLTQYIQIHGPGNWRNLQKHAGLQRCAKSCRLRWTNYLRPDIKRGRFSFEEEETIIQLHSVLGNKWSAIAARLPGRTDNEIKNYWNTHIRKRLLRMGIDPVTHAPRLDLLDLSPQLNISNLLRLQTLLNPEALRLALNLLSSHNQNPNTLLQNIQENQLLNYNQLQSQAPLIQPNQVDNIINQQISSFQNQYRNMGQFSMNPTNSNGQIFQDNNTSPATTTNTLQNCSYGVYENMKADLSDDSSFKSLHSNNSSQNLSFDSVLSTPDLSSPANVNSESGLINGGTEDEIESFCSNLLRFEIPEGLIGFDDIL